MNNNEQDVHTGERIEDLQQMAGEHLFMHGVQIADWRGKLKIFVKGEGVWVEDIEGNRLLDSMSGLWYKAAGYGQRKIIEAVYRQMMMIDSPPANSALIPQIEAASRVVSLYSDKSARVFFTSGGSESIETAVKMSKKWQHLNGKPGAYKVISRRYSYHGSTAMAVSLGGAASADPMGPEMPGVIHVVNWNSYRLPFNGHPVDVAVSCANQFEAAIEHAGPDTVAAIVAEPVSAAAGTHPPPPEYWQRLREIADKYQVLLIADEVITAFGRTGAYFALMNWNVQPDITVVAKGITSGYAPLGGVIATKKVADAFIGGQRETFLHLITFGGHPVSCAAALANLDIFEEEDLVGNARSMGYYMSDKLEDLKGKHRIIGDVRGIGLLWAIELVRSRESKESFPPEANLSGRLPRMLYERGLISFRAGNIISICPPLVINKEEIDFMIDSIDDAVKGIEKEM